MTIQFQTKTKATTINRRTTNETTNETNLIFSKAKQTRVAKHMCKQSTVEQHTNTKYIHGHLKVGCNDNSISNQNQGNDNQSTNDERRTNETTNETNLIFSKAKQTRVAKHMCKQSTVEQHTNTKYIHGHLKVGCNDNSISNQNQGNDNQSTNDERNDKRN